MNVSTHATADKITISRHQITASTSTSPVRAEDNDDNNDDDDSDDEERKIVNDLDRLTAAVEKATALRIAFRGIKLAVTIQSTLELSTGVITIEEMVTDFGDDAFESDQTSENQVTPG